jgi:hypothetical protein
MHKLKMSTTKIYTLLKKVKRKFFGHIVIADIFSIQISQCRHYCAFKYGDASFNPYEQYITGLHLQKPISTLREDFEFFLVHYRPRNFGEALGIEISTDIPLWIYPWNSQENFNPKNGWLDDIDKVSDIITHFCSQGIKRSSIQKEYFWLERAYNSILNNGYQPNQNSYIEVFELKKNKENVFIVKDGNHRLSALAALGYKEVIVKRYRSNRMNERDLEKWGQVKSGLYSKSEVLALFDIYFSGVNKFNPSDSPTKVLDK